MVKKLAYTILITEQNGRTNLDKLVLFHLSLAYIKKFAEFTYVTNKMRLQVGIKHMSHKSIIHIVFINNFIFLCLFYKKKNSTNFLALEK
jgi:hypothetical protein